MRTGDTIQIPTNGFTLFQWLPHSGNMPRQVAMCQQMAVKKKIAS